MDSNQLLQEIATFNNAGIVNFLDILPDPDIILLKRGDDSRILDDIASDEQVTQCMINRKYRVLLNERYAFKPGVVGTELPSPAAVTVHKMFLEDLENTEIYNIFAALLEAPFYGYSVLEIIWEARGGYYRIKNIIPRPHEWFGFNDKSQLIFKGEMNVQGEIVPAGKFIISRHFPTFKNPYGLRLLARCLWPVAFKKGGVKFFAQFLEKYGTPWVIANAPSGATGAEKAAMARDLASMVQDATAVIPAGATVELHSAATNQADIFNTYIDRWDKSISKVLMGQTLTADIGNTGSFAASQTHKDVSDDIGKADRLMITSAMNELAWIYTQVNFGGQKTSGTYNAAPVFKGVAAPTFSYIDDEDLTARAELDKKLYDMGVSFNAEYFEQTYGIDKKYFEVQKKETGLMPSFAAAVDNELEAAEGRQAELDKSAAASAVEIAKKANISIEKLKQAVENASDLEELEDSLADLGLDFSRCQEIIKNVLTNGAAYGFTGGNK